MQDKSENKTNLINECKTIAENCLYTAQTHFVMASKSRKKVALMILLPACIAAFAGLLTSIGLPGWIGAFSAIAGIVTATASFLGVSSEENAHKLSGNMLTCLRHEARALHETYANELTSKELFKEVQRLGDKYNSTIMLTDITDPESFEKAREQIKAGHFTPDFKTEDIK